MEFNDGLDSQTNWRGNHEMIQACKNSGWKVTVQFHLYEESFSDEIWFDKASAFMDNEVVTEVSFHDFIMDYKADLDDDADDVADHILIAELLPMIFQGTHRKLTFTGAETQLWETALSSIVMTTHAFNPGYKLWYHHDCLRHLLSCLALPTSVVDTLDLGPSPLDESWLGQERNPVPEEAFPQIAAALPQFTSLKSFVGLHICPEANANKDIIVKALWKNRSLTGKIQLEGGCMDDNDRTLLERIVQRNKNLPCLLEPQNLVGNPSLLPHLLKLSVDTDLNEAYKAIRGVDFSQFERGSDS